MNEPDDPIDLVRAARHRISERLGHDPARVVEHYLTVQEAYRGRLLQEQGANGSKNLPGAAKLRPGTDRGR